MVGSGCGIVLYTPICSCVFYTFRWKGETKSPAPVGERTPPNLFFATFGSGMSISHNYVKINSLSFNTEFFRECLIFMTLYGVTSSYFNKANVHNGLGIGTAFLSNIYRIVLSHGYGCVYKKRFRSRFQPWPEAIKWKEAREDASDYTLNCNRGFGIYPRLRRQPLCPWVSRRTAPASPHTLRWISETQSCSYYQ